MKVKTALGGALPLFAAGAALCTTGSASAQCASTLLYDNGFPNVCVVVVSQVNDTAGANPLGADDFETTTDVTINDIHWYTADESATGIGWTGDIRVAVWPGLAACGGPDKNNPIFIGDFGAGQPSGSATRTIVDPQAVSVGGVIFDIVRYDLEGLNMSLTAGTYWISVAPICEGANPGDPAPGTSFWMSSNCVANGDAIVGCGAQSDFDDGNGWSPVEVPDPGDLIDLNFQLTSCPPTGPCPADLNGSGAVDVFDLFILLNNWGTNGPGADLAGPGTVVDVFDLFVLLGAWGNCPPGPDNDECEFAELIIGTGNVPFDMAGATPDGPDDGANCTPPIPGNLPDRWWCYKSECAGFTNITLDVAAGLSVYAIAADSCSADPLPPPVACSNDGAVRFFAEEGFHYKIRISATTDVSGVMNIADCEPNNDECVDAIALFTGDTFEGTLLGQSGDTVPSCPALSGGAALGTTPGVWFVTVGDGTTYTARTCQPPDPNDPNGFSDPPGQADRIAVYCGTSCDGLIDPCILQSDPNCTLSPPGTQANVSWCSVDGVIYFLYYSMDNNVDVPGPYALTLESNGIACTPSAFESSCPGIPGRVCDIDPPDTPGDGCQLPDQMGHGSGGTLAATSDLNPAAGFTVADNMSFSSAGQLTEVCWWGIYNDFSAGADCAPGDGGGSQDDFRIRFMPDAGGLPDHTNVIATYNIGSLQLNVQKIFTGLNTGGIRQEWEFTAPLSPALSVNADECIWMEIVNTTQANCFWLWNTAPPGDGRSAQDVALDGYQQGDGSTYDLAWCVDQALGDIDAICPDEPPFECAGETDPNGCQICTVTPNFFQGNPTVVFLAFSDTAQQLADDFEVVTGGSITQVCVWGGYGGGTCTTADYPPTDSFTVNYYMDDQGAPGTQIASFTGAQLSVTRTTTGRTFGPDATDDEWEFNITHPAVNLSAGDIVWISVLNDTNSPCRYFWEDASMGDSNAVFSSNGGATWTGFGSNLAFVVNIDAMVPAPPPPPPNDDCANAIPITNGTTAYSTFGATTDGPANPTGTCNDFGANQTAHDIWFTYTATCTGTARFTTCSDLGGSADYDTDLVIYDTTDCGNLAANLLGCNDDDPSNPCGTAAPFASTLEVPVTSGTTYLLRVGGWDTGNFGDGVLNITCPASP